MIRRRAWPGLVMGVILSAAPALGAAETGDAPREPAAPKKITSKVIKKMLLPCRGNVPQEVLINALQEVMATGKYPNATATQANWEQVHHAVEDRIGCTLPMSSPPGQPAPSP